jgi:hypothetical protein
MRILNNIVRLQRSTSLFDKFDRQLCRSIEKLFESNAQCATRWRAESSQSSQGSKKFLLGDEKTSLRHFTNRHFEKRNFADRHFAKQHFAKRHFALMTFH